MMFYHSNGNDMNPRFKTRDMHNSSFIYLLPLLDYTVFHEYKWQSSGSIYTILLSSTMTFNLPSFRFIRKPSAFDQSLCLSNCNCKNRNKLVKIFQNFGGQFSFKVNYTSSFDRKLSSETKSITVIHVIACITSS